MKKNKKNISPDQERIFVDENQLAALLQDARWQPRSADEGDGKPAAVSAVEELVAMPKIAMQSIDIEQLTRITSSDIIDRFLRAESHRIVAEEGEVEREITIEAEFSEEDDMVSEELAEVYLAQGLKDMAIETYRKLSLLNPEKSIYFAELISKIEN
ncbi:MAG: hypothetical protein IKU22_00375 [Alistipes sp.]|nr:hypothetical protein [Alistipes sp.]